MIFCTLESHVPIVWFKQRAGYPLQSLVLSWKYLKIWQIFPNRVQTADCTSKSSSRWTNILKSSCDLFSWLHGIITKVAHVQLARPTVLKEWGYRQILLCWPCLGCPLQKRYIKCWGICSGGFGRHTTGHIRTIEFCSAKIFFCLRTNYAMHDVLNREFLYSLSLLLGLCGEIATQWRYRYYTLLSVDRWMDIALCMLFSLIIHACSLTVMIGNGPIVLDISLFYVLVVTLLATLPEEIADGGL